MHCQLRKCQIGTNQNTLLIVPIFSHPAENCRMILGINAITPSTRKQGDKGYIKAASTISLSGSFVCSPGSMEPSSQLFESSSSSFSRNSLDEKSKADSKKRNKMRKDPEERAATQCLPGYPTWVVQFSRYKRSLGVHPSRGRENVRESHSGILYQSLY